MSDSALARARSSAGRTEAAGSILMPPRFFEGMLRLITIDGEEVGSADTISSILA
jgi:hypothetical protein